MPTGKESYMPRSIGNQRMPGKPPAHTMKPDSTGHQTGVSGGSAKAGERVPIGKKHY